MDDIVERLYDHESKLAKVETILERVALNQDKMADAVSQISNSIVKQELILEKLSFLETNSKGSFERIHLRIDAVENRTECTAESLINTNNSIKRVEADTKENTDKLNDLEIFAMIRKYPLGAIMILLGMYSMTFQETRDLVAGVLGLF